MNATQTFTEARELIELAGLFMMILPMFMMSVLALATYYKKKN